MTGTVANPNHAVSRVVSDNWQNFLALLVAKGGGHVVITPADIAAFPSEAAMTVQELDDGLHFRLVDYSTGMEIAKREGGMPL